MAPELSEFLNSNASAVFGLVGALGGALLSFAATLILKRREFDLQTRARLLDRQISAHEGMLQLAMEMRTMVAPGGLDEAGEMLRGPSVLRSKANFESWFQRFTLLQTQGSTWLTTETKREVSLVQDYLATLYIHLSDVPDDQCFRLGCLIRQDFIDLSSSLETIAFRFFEKGVRRLRLDSPRSWHKYKPEVTERRLNAFQLFKQLPKVKVTKQRVD